MRPLRPLDWIRAGALTAGVAELLAVWWKGLDRLGYMEWPSGFDWTFMLTIAVSVAVGATLGHNQPRPLWARVPLAFVVACAFGAGLIGLSFLLVKFADVAERNLPPFFVVAGVGLIAWGLRRIPRRPAVRAALVAVVVLLTAVRLLATFPALARHIERRLFPLPPAEIRAAFARHGCGGPCEDGRSRVLDFQHEIAYGLQAGYALSAEVKAHAVLETQKAFFIDGCGSARATRPEIPASVRDFPNVGACIAARPNKYRLQWEAPSFDTDCCTLGVRERLPGERFDLTRTLPFAFFRGKWALEGERRRER